MDWGALTFSIKDVVMIVGGTITLSGTFIGVSFKITQLAFRVKQNKIDLEMKIANLGKEMDEEFMHLRNARKSYGEDIKLQIGEMRSQYEKSEFQIYAEIKEVQNEQKKEHLLISNKMDKMSEEIGKVGNNLSELNGYLRGSGKV